MMRRIFVLAFGIAAFLIINAFAYEVKAYRFPAKAESLSLVLIALDYPDKDMFLKDIKIIANGLLQIQPFSEVKMAVNIFYITLNEKEARLFLKRTEQEMPPVKVRIDFMQEISKVTNPYKLIILDWRGDSACAELSMIDKTSLVILGRNRYSSDVDFLKGFLHELGHCLGLRDECVDCQESQPGYPNCAPTKELAEKWWGNFIGSAPQEVNYIKGCCGNIKYFRPTNVSLMNNTANASGYGYVNEKYLQQELLRLRDKRSFR